MGSNEEIVNGGAFSNLYVQNDKPRELLVNRLAQDSNHGIVMGTYKADERLLGIVTYFSPKNEFIHTSGAIESRFDALSAMGSTTDAGNYDLGVTYAAAWNNTNIVKADYSDMFPPTVNILSIVESVNGVGDTILTYELDTGYVGTVGKLNVEIKAVGYAVDTVLYTHYFFVFEYTLEADSSLEFFVEPIKQDKQRSPDRESYMTMNKMGTTVRSFEDAFKDDKLVDLMYTYAGKTLDPLVRLFTDSIVGSSIDVIIDDNTSLHIFRVGLQDWRCAYNGTVLKDADDDYIIVLPMEFFHKQTIVNKYISVKKYLGLLSFSTDTVEIKWYQTAFFKFLLGVVLFIWGMFTGDFGTFISYVFSSAIGMIFADNYVVQILLAVVTLGYSAVTAGFTIMTAMQLASLLLSSYAKIQVDNVLTESTKVDQEAKELQHAANKYKRQFLYTPLSEIPSLYDLSYNSISASYNMLATIKEPERSYFGY